MSNERLRATLVEIGNMIETAPLDADAWAILVTICSMARAAVAEEIETDGQVTEWQRLYLR